MAHDPTRLRATLLLLLTTVFWAVSFTTMKALGLAQQAILPACNSWFISSLCITVRFAVATLVMFLWCLPTLRRLTWLEMWQGLGLGLFGGVALILQMDGLSHTAASTSAFLTQGYCLLIPLWTALVGRRWPSGLVLACCALVVTGGAILSEVRWDSLRLGRGELETLLASVLFTGQILWLQRPAFARNKVSHFTAVMFAVITLCAFPVAWANTGQAGDWVAAYRPPITWLCLGILVVLCTLTGYLLMNRWQPHVTATEAGLIYCAEPVFTSVTALFLPGWFSGLARISYANEALTWRLLCGGGLITLANVLIQLPVARRRADAQPASSTSV